MRKGVEFRIGTAIKEATEEGIIVANGDDTELIKSETVVWAQVFVVMVLWKSLALKQCAGVKVDEYMHAPGYEDVFMVGDAR